jgi:hypothetical protein
MQQWEYAEIRKEGHECYIFYGTPGQLVLKVEPSEPEEKVPGILTKKMIARYGIAGWEMVKYGASRQVWHFKRLIQQHPKTTVPLFVHIAYISTQRIRQRWEYAEIQSTERECSLLYYRPSQHHGFTLKASEPDEQMPGVLAKKLIDQLTRHGWEVVSDDPSQRTWYLKHLLDEDSSPEWVEEIISEQNNPHLNPFFDQQFEQ